MGRIQHLILKCVNEWAGKNKTITIARKTFPALRGSAMRDFFEILEEMKLYLQVLHNKSSHEYKLYGNLIEFISPDQETKWKGRKRDILWLNETNEFDYQDFLQGILRTSESVFMDYNPSDEYHWIYEKILPRDDVDFRKFTIYDNPLAPSAIKEEILRLKDEDENLWQIYGLGEIGKSGELVYPDWQKADFPPVCEYYRYGVDFGYNHPSVLLLTGIRENNLYIKELIYQTHLTNQDFIDLMKELEVSKQILMKADSAEPDRIKEISLAGYNIAPAFKSRAFNKDAIDSIKRRKIYITSDSVNIIKEFKNYKWKKDKKTGDILDEPVKYKDDACDAVKYAVGDIIRDRVLFQRGRPVRDLPRRALSTMAY